MNETDVTISISKDEADVIYRVLTQISPAIKTFETECKHCKKRINMMSNDGGRTWRPTSRKSGKLHRCKEYMEKTKKEHRKD